MLTIITKAQVDIQDQLDKAFIDKFVSPQLSQGSENRIWSLNLLCWPQAISIAGLFTVHSLLTSAMT